MAPEVPPIRISAGLIYWLSAWLQILRGTVQAYNEVLTAGDGLAVSYEAVVQLKAKTAAEVMLFDLA